MSKKGYYKEFFPEGQLKSTSWWHDGKLNGEKYVYNKFGRLLEHSYYEDNKEIKKPTVDEEIRVDGKLVEIYKYKDGQLNGEYKRWSNGRLILHGLYKENILIEKNEDGRNFNSLVDGENELNKRIEGIINYKKCNISFGRFNESKDKFIIPAFPGINNIKEIKKIIKEIDIFEHVVFNGNDYTFFIK